MLLDFFEKLLLISSTTTVCAKHLTKMARNPRCFYPTQLLETRDISDAAVEMG